MKPHFLGHSATPHALRCCRPPLLSPPQFDCDGVLVDTERDGHRISFNEAFKQKGGGRGQGGRGTTIGCGHMNDSLRWEPIRGRGICSCPSGLGHKRGVELYGAEAAPTPIAPPQALTTLGMWSCMASCLRLVAVKSE